VALMHDSRPKSGICLIKEERVEIIVKNRCLQWLTKFIPYWLVKEGNLVKVRYGKLFATKITF